MLLSLLTLTGLPLSDATTLCRLAGSAQAAMAYRHDIRQLWPDASDATVQLLQGDLSHIERRAEEEQQWAERNNVRIVRWGDDDFPTRLLPVCDAPTVLYVRGGIDMNPLHVIAMVGTRNISQYGRDVVTRLMKGLRDEVPDLQVVSGLAYGVDICAHRQAMEQGLQTVAVVAHGQDTLYPSAHRTDANRMIARGMGNVVTEYPHDIRPDRWNFLQRNRIIAALSDATVVVESAHHGGSLVTARQARSYGREVFAVPGSILGTNSEGCHNLISEGKARLLTGDGDIIKVLGWDNSKILAEAQAKGIERQMFVELNGEERLITDYLKEHGDAQTNIIARDLGMGIGTVTSTLFALEMKGVVRPMPGNMVHLLPM